jgi:hypothetical protein
MMKKIGIGVKYNEAGSVGTRRVMLAPAASEPSLYILAEYGQLRARKEASEVR